MVTLNEEDCMANFRFAPTVELPFAVRPTAPTRVSVQERTQLINTPPKEKNGCGRAAAALFIFCLALGVFFVLGTFFVIEEKEAAIVSDLHEKVLRSSTVSAAEADEVLHSLFGDAGVDVDAASIVDVQNATFHLAAAVETLRKHHISK